VAISELSAIMLESTVFVKRLLFFMVCCVFR
jgi:hypothetical protein